MGMQMEMSYVWAVVVTGLVVVFAGLILLILFISLIGKIFETMEKSKKQKNKKEESANLVKTVQEPAKVQTVSENPSSDDDEVIAVISAAVAMMAAAENKAYRIKSVRPAKKKSGAGNVWAMAGIRENTNPF